MARIERLLAERTDGASLSAFLPAVGAEVADQDSRRRAAVASTLVAGLVLARQGRILMGQESDWGRFQSYRNASTDQRKILRSPRIPSGP